MLNYKSRHVFGPEANVDGALLSGDIDFFDILFLDEGKIGWITETGEKFIIEDKVQVRVEDELPNEGVENVLFVCGKSLYVWDGSEYVLIVDDYMSLEDRVSKLEDASGQIDSHNTSDKAHADIRSIVSDNANEIAQIKNGAELETFADVESILMELAYGISGGSELETETNFIVPAINEVHFELDELKEALQELIIIDYTKLEFDVTELVSLAHIYGVSWDRTDTPVLTRIDEAASFPSPVVAVDTSVGSSPFDNLMPWAGMEKITDENGQSLVSIPKFWYRWTSTEDALTLQIADAPVNGFHVSPMHADRGDGKGERDVAYIGRYHCAVEGALMGSITNALPLTDVPRTGARYGITSAAGDGGYFLQDFAAWWTIRMLFLVEYATWDGQAVIGEGNISGSIVKNGATDNMIYHTGMVTVANGDAGNQYRWIENPCQMWANGSMVSHLMVLTFIFSIILSKCQMMLRQKVLSSSAIREAQMLWVGYKILGFPIMKDWNMPYIPQN